MKTLLLMGGFLITLLAGLSSFSQLRIHFRTGMKTYLYLGISFLLCTFFFLEMTIWGMFYDFLREYISDTLLFFVMLALYLAALIIGYSGDAILLYDESELWKQIFEKTTFWQRLTGNVPILKDEKLPSPAISKQTSIIIGIIAMTLGSLTIIPYIVFKIQTIFTSFLIGAVHAFIFGLLLVFFSFICLDKGKKPPE